MQKRSVPSRHFFLRDMSPVIRFMILSDILIVGAGGLLGPVFALFIEDYIIGGGEAVAGIAAGIFLFTKSILQIPVANMIDRVRGEKDDFWFLTTFSLLMGAMPLAYLFISTPMQLYVVQFFYGIVTALTFPSYMTIFTRHIDKGKEGTEWGVYYTFTDIVSALLAVVGGYMAAREGFDALIMVVSIMGIGGSLMLFPIRKYLKLR